MVKWPRREAVGGPTRWASALRLVAIGVGAFVVLVGAASLMTRMADATFDGNAAQQVFGPAAAIGDPSVLNAVHSGNAAATSDLATSTATSTPFDPVTLKIPSIGVNAHVEDVGKKADGSMATPSTFGDVAWYSLGGQPGGQGNVVIDGHVDNALTTAGVFEHLSQVQVGDYVTVEDAQGHSLVYKVSTVQDYPAGADAPDASIFDSTGPSQLVLITCDGDWVPSQKEFNERLVVTAQPVYQ